MKNIEKFDHVEYGFQHVTFCDSTTGGHQSLNF